MKRFLSAALSVLLSANIALATPAEQWTNTTGACSNDGDGSASGCAASPAAAGAFNSCATFFNQDLTLTQDLLAHFTGTCTSIGAVNGWVTTSGRAKLSGLTLATTDYGIGFDLDDDNFDFIDCSLSKGSGTLNITLLDLQGSTGSTLDRCRIFHNGTARDAGTAMIQLGTNSGTKITNSFIYDCVGAGQSCLAWAVVGANSITLDNNTFHGGANVCVEIGVDGANSGGSVTIRNNIGYCTGTDWDINPGSQTYTHSANISGPSDNSSPDAAFRDKTLTFVNAGAKDFHLDAGETDAIDVGTDLTGTVTTDIDSESRPQGGGYEIGADEITSGATPKIGRLLQAMGEL